jgi:hypothetical protein
VQFPLTPEFLDEAERFALRSSCGDCLHQAAGGACALEWPNDDQRQWPPAGATVSFCKEFELR